MLDTDHYTVQYIPCTCLLQYYKPEKIIILTSALVCVSADGTRYRLQEHGILALHAHFSVPVCGTRTTLARARTVTRLYTLLWHDRNHGVSHRGTRPSNTRSSTHHWPPAWPEFNHELILPWVKYFVHSAIV